MPLSWPCAIPHLVAAVQPLSGAMEGIRCCASESCASREPVPRSTYNTCLASGGIIAQRSAVIHHWFLSSSPPREPGPFPEAPGFRFLGER